MNVFVLCTGRCGSLTFSKACEHITNYTIGHESKSKIVGEKKLAFDDNHIEIDNRLLWYMGRLDDAYGDNAFYVHLKRNKEETANSFYKKIEQRVRDGRTNYASIAFGYGQCIAQLEGQYRAKEVLGDMVDTMETNINFFLKTKPQQMTIEIERANEQFGEFWRRVGAEGDYNAAIAEFDKRYNSTDDSDVSMVRSEESEAVSV